MDRLYRCIPEVGLPGLSGELGVGSAGRGLGAGFSGICKGAVREAKLGGAGKERCCVMSRGKETMGKVSEMDLEASRARSVAVRWLGDSFGEIVGEVAGDSTCLDSRSGTVEDMSSS